MIWETNLFDCCHTALLSCLQSSPHYSVLVFLRHRVLLTAMLVVIPVTRLLSFSSTAQSKLTQQLQFFVNRRFIGNLQNGGLKLQNQENVYTLNSLNSTALY